VTGQVAAEEKDICMCRDIAEKGKERTLRVPGAVRIPERRESQLAILRRRIFHTMMLGPPAGNAKLGTVTINR